MVINDKVAWGGGIRGRTCVAGRGKFVREGGAQGSLGRRYSTGEG